MRRAIVIVLCLSARAIGQDFIYIPGDYPTIQDGIDAAVDGNEVIVAPGTYFENIDFGGKGITLRASDPDPTATIIDGGGADSVIKILSGNGALQVVEGFTIQNGEATFGGGLHTTRGPTIRACAFEHNIGNSQGGAIAAFGSGIVIEDCAFRFNESSTFSGAVHCAIDDQAIIRRCDFRSNIGVMGAGFSACIFQDSDGEMRISNCEFWNNRVETVIELEDGTIANCLLRDNVVDQGIDVRSGVVSVVNCTVVHTEGVGVRSSSGAATVVNSIVRNNDGDSLAGSGFDVSYSNIAGGHAGVGNIDVPAQFVDSEDDFHLDAGSPCIDAGTNGVLVLAVDLDGIRRVINDPDVIDTGDGAAELVDMGCYERLPAVRYVDRDASGLNTGHAWSDAYTDLQDALDEARSGDVSEIWVAAGLYKPDRGTDDPTMSFEMISGVDIRGGYAGDELDRDELDPRANVTTLGGAIGGSGTADNTHHVVMATNVDATGRLYGFTVQRGNAQGPIENGGGIYIDGGGPVIRSCTLRLNEASLGGAGLYSKDADTQVHHCQVHRNENLGAVPGAGMSFLRGDALVTNSFIYGNDGGGLGIGLYHLDGTLAVVNSTIYGNVSAQNWTGGVFNAGGTLEITNSIVWGNRGDGGSLEAQQLRDSDTMTVDYSCVEGWTDVSIDGTATIADDPLLVDADGDDDIIGTADDNVRLMPGSPAIDSGDSGALPAYVSVDLDGLPRYVDDPLTADTGIGPPPIVDRGAYEYQFNCPADVTGDGMVDVQDLLAVLATWGPCGGCAEDIDDSGAVDIGDLLAVLAAWGPC